jgi:hypothetical protein
LVALGLGLALAPLIFNMFERAPKGADMLNDFRPYMTQQKIGTFQRYMREIDAGVDETDSGLRPYLAEHAGIDQAQFDTRFETFVSFSKTWPHIDDDMSDLLRKVRANIGNYEAMDGLPSFDLFPWFFVVPGLLIAGAAGLALARPGARNGSRWLLVALGLGLIAAPFVIGIFSAAPKGEEMMNDFESIVTTKRIHTIQGYFADMAVGEGAIRLDVIPAAEGAGLGSDGLAQQFPDVSRLRRGWIGIINDMTPMIGAMSDNVDNYDAIHALPPFGLFPWFFLAPGAIVVVLALRLRRVPNGGTPPPSGSLTATTDDVSPDVEKGTTAMSNHRSIRVALATLALGAGLVASALPASAAKAKAKPLVGTFKLDAGACSGSTATGSYFRMVLAGGTADAGPYFPDPDSECATDKTYILVKPGTDGGLITGKYQTAPTPGFDAQGNSLSNKIIQPQGFTAINFGVSSNKSELQTKSSVPKPSIKVKGGKLTGDVSAITGSWNNQDFSQGAPKPDGSSPGNTAPVTGTYDAKTKHFVITWVSQIAGGPFNDFAGVWHLEGTFTPAK